MAPSWFWIWWFSKTRQKSWLTNQEFKEVNKSISYSWDYFDDCKIITDKLAKVIIKTLDNNPENIFYDNISKLINNNHSTQQNEISNLTSIYKLLSPSKTNKNIRINEILEISQFAGFPELEILTKEYILRKELNSKLTQNPYNVEEVSDLYKEYFKNYVWFITEEKDLTKNKLPKNNEPNPEELLSSPKFNLQKQLNKEKAQEIKDKEEKSLWEKIWWLF